MFFFQILKRSTRTPQILHLSSLSSSSSSINSYLISTQTKNFCSKTIENNSIPITPQIATEAETICKLITTQNKNNPPQIQSLLSTTQIKLTPLLVTQVLKKLTNAGVFALSFFKFAEKQPGFKHDTETYNAVIEALGKIKQFSVIWKLVTEMKEKGILDKITFGLITRRYARSKRVKEAIETFNKMEKFGLKAELSDFNRFLDTLCKSRQVETAHKVFDEMSKRRFNADIKTYTILLEGCGQEANLLKLDEVYREMKGHGFEPDVVVYAIVINAYCKARKYDLAISKFYEMRRKGLEPNPHIYCTLINGLGSEKRLSESLKFFELSKSNGHIPDTPTYNAVIGAYCWSMQISNAFKLIEEMTSYKIGPNSRTFDIILHHLTKGKRTKEAYDVFTRMRDEFGCEPSLSTYEIMVRMFCNEGEMKMAVNVWETMKDEGVVPGMHMFVTLIHGLCREKNTKDVCRFFDEMLDMGIRPPMHMFNEVKRALVDDGKEDVVVMLTHRLAKLKALLVVS